MTEGANDVMKLRLLLLMALVLNWASSWANQTSVPAGQNGGSLILTAPTEAGADEPSVIIYVMLLVFS